MLGYLILLFIAVPIIELSLLIKVGQLIGVFNTLLIVIGTGVLGAYLARMEGMRTLIGIQEDINSGKMPAEKMVDGVVILISGILLLTPGIITDLIGFAGLIPATRNLLKQWLKNKMRGMVDRGEVITITSYKAD